jgi:hypothetical protein
MSLRARARVRTPSRPSRLRLERLEDRAVPATFSWTGGINHMGTNWFDPGNWLGPNGLQAVPGPADDANIGAPNVGDPSTVFVSASASVRSLVTSRTVQVNAGTFSLGSGVSSVSTLNLIGATLDIADGAQLSQMNVNGAGPYVQPAGRTLNLFATTFNMPVTNNGTLQAVYINSISGFTVNGAVANQAGATIRLLGGVTRLNNGLANHGAIELTSTPLNATPSDSTNLSVGGTTFTNFADGTVTAVAGSGGRREIGLQDNITLNNQGLVRTIGNSLRLVSGSLPGSTFQTTGTVAIDDTCLPPRQ